MDESDPTLKANIRKLALATFSMPAAVGLLDKYDSRLGLSDILKRVVRNYEAVANALWDALRTVIPLPPDFDTRFWTFFLLILSPAAVELMRLRVSGRKLDLGRPGFWGYASAIAFIGYCIAFSTSGAVLGGVIESAITLVVSVLVVALTFGVLVAVGVWRPGPRKLTPRQQRRNEVLGSGIVAMAFLGLLLFTPKITGIISDMTGIPDIHGAKGLAALASIILAVLFAFGNLRTPAYAFFWMFGIVAIDWLATDAVPAMDGWLDRATLPTP